MGTFNIQTLGINGTIDDHLMPLAEKSTLLAVGPCTKKKKKNTYQHLLSQRSGQTAFPGGRQKKKASDSGNLQI